MAMKQDSKQYGYETGEEPSSLFSIKLNFAATGASFINNGRETGGNPSLLSFSMINHQDVVFTWSDQDEYRVSGGVRRMLLKHTAFNKSLSIGLCLM